MKFFIDTANVDEIKKAAELGVLDGVTTNPSLLAKEKGNFKDILKRICERPSPNTQEYSGQNPLYP